MLFRPTGILSEVGPCLAVRRLRDVLGEDEVRVVSVRFAHAARGPVAPYEEFFRAHVEFDTGSESVVWPRCILDAPLLSPPRRPSRGCSPLIRPRPRPRPVTMASSGALKMSTRTLQRKVAEHGTSYSALLDEVRREEAERLLSYEGLLLADVAFRLGFRNLNAFFRAFREWTGKTPRQFQRAMRPDPTE